MTSRQPEEATIATLARMGLMGVTTAGVGSTVAHGLDGLFHSQPVDVTGLGGGHLDSGTVMHHGPEAGGGLMDRPSAGYLAHASMGSGVEIHQGMDVTTIARDVDKAGTLTIDGNTISVLDYMPGGDFVQMAAGHVDPSQLIMTLAQHGLEQQMNEGGRAPGDAEISNAGDDAVDPRSGMNRTNRNGDIDADIPPDAPEEIGSADDEIGHAHHDRAARHPHTRIGPGEAHIPDADENARDMEELALQHKLNLDTSVETSDTSMVHTELHAHGRTLEMDTSFEATARSNRAEREEAGAAVEEMVHSPLSEGEHNRPDMHFRSRVQAHLDAMSRDEGMTM